MNDVFHFVSMKGVKRSERLTLGKQLEVYLLKGNPKWKRSTVNRKFLKTLRERFGKRAFTNMDAYEVYFENHYTVRRKYEDKLKEYGSYRNIPSWLRPSWMEMNVRNTLCAAVLFKEFGLIRVNWGKYRFVK